jgi:fucose permease
LSGSYLIAFVPLCFPSIAALDKYGLKTGIVIAMLLTALGCVLKCFVN